MENHFENIHDNDQKYSRNEKIDDRQKLVSKKLNNYDIPKEY